MYQRTLFIKLIIIPLLILTDTNTVEAQTWNEINMEVVKYIKENNYLKATEFSEKALILAKNEFGKNHIKYAASSINLAELFRQTGLYKKAELLLIEAKIIIEKEFGKEDPSYAAILNNLAVLYTDMGNYLKAEPLLFEARIIRENYFGKQHQYYADSNNNLAALYYSLGNYKKAEPLLVEAKEIFETVFGKNHIKYAASCNNLGEYYKTIKEFKKAEVLLIEAKKIRENVLGKKNIQYAESCNNLGGLYFSLKNYKKAEVLFIEAKNIFENTYGTEHILFANSCNNLAALYLTIGNFQEAEQLFINAKNIIKKKFGEKHPNYAQSCINLASLYDNIGDTIKDIDIKEATYWKAYIHFIETSRLLNNYILESTKFLSENEREEYLTKKINDPLDICYSFLLTKQKGNWHVPGILYNNSLNLKGQLLKSSIALRKTAVQSGDTVLINLYNEMNEYGKMLSVQNSLPISKRGSDTKYLKTKINTLEKELIQKSQIYAKSKRNRDHWQDIRMALEKNEIAIEFIHFRYQNKNRWTDSTFYYALLLRKSYNNPEAVFLFEEKQLQNIMKRSIGANEYKYIKDLYDPKSAKADSLYKMVWEPIEKYMKDVKDVYISPVGMLNKISFDAIPYNTTNIISDKYKIIYTTSTAGVKNKIGLFQKDVKNSALFGGIDYNVKPEEIEKLQPDSKTKEKRIHRFKTFLGIRNIDSLTRNITWNYLPGSLEETKEIQNILKKEKVAVKLFTEKYGNEKQFKSLENDAPSIIHISTHGFYFEDDENNIESKNILNKDIKFTDSENPLLRSGFILAGGNNAFQGRIISESVEDGILTAAEISRLNFFNTKLAVLSACQTGLGDVKGNEGVYGLQRSFKMAGVDYLLFSLWSVPDETTKELMTNFYKNWFSGMEIRDAFKKAQNQLKLKYTDVPGAAFAWAAFVLMN